MSYLSILKESMKKNYYLLHFKFNGLHFHGVQKQPNFTTLSSYLESALKTFFPTTNFSLIFSSRLDALVSSSSMYVQVLCEERWNQDDLTTLQTNLNKRMHDFVYIYSIGSTPKFHLQDFIEEKTYQYCFTDKKNLESSTVVHFSDLHNIEIIKEAASLFNGEINILPFSFRGKETQETTRIIHSSSLICKEDGTYVFEVRARGFIRGQVRMMMGALVKLASSQLTLDEFKEALHSKQKKKLGFMVPAKALLLVETKLKNLDVLK